MENINDFVIILNEDYDLVNKYEFKKIKYYLTFNELIRHILNELIFLIKDKKEFEDIKLIIIKHNSSNLLLKK